MKTAEPKAAEWISEAIGKVEIERLKETKFDGTRSGHNFSLDRQIEPLVMGSEITGLDDRHAYLKLGNNVARFDFDYLDLPTPTPGFLPRKHADGGMCFDPDTLEPYRPSFVDMDEEDEDYESEDDSEMTASQPVADGSTSGAPISHARKPRPIPWPKENENEPARAGETNRPAPTSGAQNPSPSSSPQNETETAQQVLFANGTVDSEGTSVDLRP